MSVGDDPVVGPDQYRVLFEQAAVGMAVVSPEGRWLEVNEQFVTMLGYTRDELRQLTFADITHPDERDRDLRAARHLVRGTIRRYVVEKRYVRKDGGVCWAQLTTTYVPPAQGRDGYFVSVVENIDQRRRVEAALRISEARYRGLVDAAASIVWTASPSGEFTEPQRAWAAYTGQDFAAHRGFGWLQAVHATDRAQAEQAWRTAIRNSAAYQVECRVRRADGEYRWFHARATPVRGPGGAVEDWVGALTDIDEQVRRRVRTELLQDAGKLLGEAVDRRAMLEQVASLTIGTPQRPGMADGVTVTVVGDGGRFERIAVRSVDLAKAALVAEIDRRYPTPDGLPRGYPAVIRTGRSELLGPEMFEDERLRAVATDEEHLQLLRSLQVYCELCVPLTARGKTYGALTLVLHGPERRPPFDGADLQAAEELARRMALGVDNARLYAEATEAREALQRVFTQAPMPIAVLDGPEHVFTFANSAYQRLVNRDLIGRRVTDAIPEVEHRFIELLGSVYRTGQPFTASEVPVMLAHAIGAEPERRYFDFTYQPLRDGSGAVYAIVAVAAEVTDQVRARERLVESETQLRNLVDAIPTLAWTARADGYIDWYNARWYEYTGTTPTDMQGWGWQAVHDPAHLPRVLERWRASIATGEPFEMTFPLRGADGRFRAFLTRVSPVRDAAGQVWRWFGTNTDVEAERAARAAAEAAAERTERLQALTAALARTRTLEEVAHVVVAEVSSAMQSATGLLALRVPGTDDVELVRETGLSPDVTSRYRRFPAATPLPAATCIRTGEPIFIESLLGPDGLLARFPGGSELWQRMRTQAVVAVPLAVAGTVVGAMSFTFTAPRYFDRGAREFLLALGQQAAQALERARLFQAERAALASAERARAAAEEANQAKTVFLATMSHELRTPLNAIAGYADLLLMELHGPLTDRQRDELQRIQRNQRHLLGLINDVLNFAKLEAGQVEYDITDVPLRMALDAVEPLVMPQLQAKGLRFVREEPDGLAVRADSEKLQQIIVNLASNAIKFTPRGGLVRIRASLGDGVVAVTVEDTGIGIAADRLDQIFAPFVQVNRRLNAPHEGTGLGLAISRDLARAMGGDLTVTSTPGQGSAFTLTLPATAAEKR